MKKLVSYNEFLYEKFEAQLQIAVIRTLHEGVRMTQVKTINEGLVEYANKEIDTLMKSAKAKGDTLIIADFIPEIKSLVKKFAESGQSGGSAPYSAGAITKTLEKLFKFHPLTPVMNEDSEWNDVSKMFSMKERSYFQNNKLSSVFKEKSDGKPYYLDAIVFKGNNDCTFTGNSISLVENGKATIGSSQTIKSFPFEPKTFIIDVMEKEYKKLKDGSLVEEKDGGWWESWIKDPKQLDEVLEYYDKLDRKK